MLTHIYIDTCTIFGIITIIPGAHPAKKKLQNVEIQLSLPCETYGKTLNVVNFK